MQVLYLPFRVLFEFILLATLSVINEKFKTAIKAAIHSGSVRHRSKFREDMSSSCWDMVFKMAAVRRFGFSKILMASIVERVNLRLRAYVCGYRQFFDFQGDGPLSSGIFKSPKFNGPKGKKRRPLCVSMPNFKFDALRRFVFSKWRPSVRQFDF